MKIQKWGNSLALRIAGPIRSIPNFKAGMQVDVEISERGIRVKLWIDFEPKKGKENGKYRPALVLSSKLYNSKTGLLICCPISTSICGGLTEVPVYNLEKPSVVAASIIHTLSWRDRKAKLIDQAEDHVLPDVLARLLPLMGAA